VGNWAIVVTGHGSHHNKKPDIDADIMTAELVDKLKAAGQVIEYASFTNGGSDNQEMLALKLIPAAAQ
jgi:hypothetical protein